MIPFDIRVYAQGKPIEVESVSIVCSPHNMRTTTLEIKAKVPWAIGSEPPKDYVGPKIKVRTRKGGDDAKQDA
jgi:hypothetical protein